MRNIKYPTPHLFYMDDIKLYAYTYAHLKELYKITEEFSNSIGMEFGMDKCRTQTIIRGQVRVGENIETLSRKTIVPLDEREVYKYLGVLQNGRIDHTAAKPKLINKFNGRLKKVLHTSLNAQLSTPTVSQYSRTHSVSSNGVPQTSQRLNDWFAPI
jgi:hypothetical protein